MTSAANETAHEAASPGVARPAIFLAASIPDGKKDYPGCERHRASAHPQWIRDAVLALARQAFEVDIDLVFGAHPSISPMLLTVAQEFPLLPEPRITVFQSAFFAGTFPQETLELTDPSHGLGRLVQTPSAGDLLGSLRAMREAMFQYPGLCSGVFVGGMDGLFDEADLFKTHNPRLPTYAVASTGGAALDLLVRSTVPVSASHQAAVQYTPDQFCGAPVAPIDPALLITRGVGYTRLARALVGRVQVELGAGVLQPRA